MRRTCSFAASEFRCSAPSRQDVLGLLSDRRPPRRKRGRGRQEEHLQGPGADCPNIGLHHAGRVRRMEAVRGRSDGRRRALPRADQPQRLDEHASFLALDIGTWALQGNTLSRATAAATTASASMAMSLDDHLEYRLAGFDGNRSPTTPQPAPLGPEAGSRNPYRYRRTPAIRLLRHGKGRQHRRASTFTPAPTGAPRRSSRSAVGETARATTRRMAATSSSTGRSQGRGHRRVRLQPLRRRQRLPDAGQAGRYLLRTPATTSTPSSSSPSSGTRD